MQCNCTYQRTRVAANDSSVILSHRFWVQMSFNISRANLSAAANKLSKNSLVVSHSSKASMYMKCNSALNVASSRSSSMMHGMELFAIPQKKKLCMEHRGTRGEHSPVRMKHLAANREGDVRAIGAAHHDAELVPQVGRWHCNRFVVVAQNDEATYECNHIARVKFTQLDEAPPGIKAEALGCLAYQQTPLGMLHGW